MKIVILLITIIALYLIVQGIRCHIVVKESAKVLDAYNPQSIELSYGNLTYIDKGEGEVILSVHGIFGGYDQAYETCKDFSKKYRILAPSRFGYLGSDIRDEGTPAKQAAAYAELLDKLGIEKVYLLSTSAGGSVAYRFALDFPDRVKGLILYCSAMPLSSKPYRIPGYAGPPSFLCNDYAMFLISPLFESVMGMKPSVINSMMPIGERKAGVVLDAAVTNRDLAVRYDEYDVENIKVPILIVHAKDDKLAKYGDVENALCRFSNYELISFETGGHLIEGHEDDVHAAVTKFIEQYR